MLGVSSDLTGPDPNVSGEKDERIEEDSSCNLRDLTPKGERGFSSL